MKLFIKFTVFIFISTICFAANKDIQISASNTLKPEARYSPNNILDDDLSTAWVEGANGFGQGEYIEFKFKTPKDIEYFGIVPGYAKYNDAVGEVWFQNNRVAKATLIFNDGTTTEINIGDYRLMQYFPVHKKKVKSVKLVINNVYKNTRWDDTCISEVEFVEKETPDLTIDGGAEFIQWKKGENKMSFALKLNAPFVMNETRKPIHIVLVIDISGSMMGEPLKFAKEAAKLVVSALKDGDEIGLVTFSTTARIDYPITTLNSKSKTELLDRINNLYEEESTNISDAINLGALEIFKTNNKPNFGRYLMFFTDGQANQGIVNPTELAVFVKDRSKSSNSNISTFGLGTQFQEDLLQIMAEQSKGRYYFVKNPKEMISYFGAELGRIVGTSAKNTKVTIKLPKNLKLSNVDGGNQNFNLIEVGDLKAGASKMIYFDVEGQSSDSINVTVDYFDTKNLKEKTISKSFKIKDPINTPEQNSLPASWLAVYRSSTLLADSADMIKSDRPNFVLKIEDRLKFLKQENLVLKSKYINKEIEYLEGLLKDINNKSLDGELLIKGIKYKVKLLERVE